MRHNIQLQLFSRTNSMRFTFVFLLAAQTYCQTVGKTSRFFPREVSNFRMGDIFPVLHTECIRRCYDVWQFLFVDFKSYPIMRKIDFTGVVSLLWVHGHQGVAQVSTGTRHPVLFLPRMLSVTLARTGSLLKQNN